MVVPRFIKHGVVTGFNDPGSRVKVDDVLVGCCIPKKYSRVVVMIEFATSFAWLSDAYP